MIFSSIYFVFLFLPIVLLIYFLCPGKFKNAVLLAASLVFYAYGEPKFVFVLMASVAVNYLTAIAIDKSGSYAKKKILLITDITLNTGLLFVYKYLGFFAGIISSVTGAGIPGINILLPVGISFFTFQALSYVIDVYRGEKPLTNIIDLALYICLFPQLIAGPIVRYRDIKDQLKSPSRLAPVKFASLLKDERFEAFGYGAERFITGFCKKVLIANQVAVIADSVFDMPDFAAATPLMAWLGSICYTLQIYYDFSGYSDMAIGLGRMFGFKFNENFDYPYISSSITGFWRRWHISLSAWFRDYVYIPLGGSRVKTCRRIFNLFVVWLLTGLWHGANFTFIAWGLIYFVLLVAEKYLIKPDRFNSVILKLTYRVFTLLCVSLLWVIFRSPSLSFGITYIGRMLGAGSVSSAAGGALAGQSAWLISMMREYGIFLAAAIIFIFPFCKKTGPHTTPLQSRIKKAADMLSPLLLPIMFLWACSYLLLGMHNPFLYFNF